MTVEGRPLEDETRRDEWRRDAELIERARKGDVMAYEELIRTYQDVAIRTAAAFAPDGVHVAIGHVDGETGEISHSGTLYPRHRASIG